MASIDQKNFNKESFNLKCWIAIVFIAKITIIFCAYSCINHHFYENYIKIVEQSLIPYRDFNYEYPPLFAFINAIPFNLIKFKNNPEYQIFFQIFTLIFDLMAMQISLKILEKLNNKKLEVIKKNKFYLIWCLISFPLSLLIYQCLEYIVIFIFVLNILYFNISNNKYNFKFY